MSTRHIFAAATLAALYGLSFHLQRDGLDPPYARFWLGFALEMSVYLFAVAMLLVYVHRFARIIWQRPRRDPPSVS